MFKIFEAAIAKDKKPCFHAFMNMRDALEEAKRKAGGSSALARELGDITPQAVGQWGRVPVTRVLDVERVTGVSRHLLRPDIYPVEKTVRGRK